MQDSSSDERIGVSVELDAAKGQLVVRYDPHPRTWEVSRELTFAEVLRRLNEVAVPYLGRLADPQTLRALSSALQIELDSMTRSGVLWAAAKKEG